MILFLPISVYRAHYHVAEGRPYSAFERILLSAIEERDPSNEGGPFTTTLATKLHVPERLVIEAVATLLEAEWIALDQANRLVVTSAGRRALKDPTRLPPDMVVRKNSVFIVQERVCGQIVLQEGVSYERRALLEKEGRWEKTHALPPSDAVPNSLDPGQVIPLLRVGPNAYLSWVGPVDIHHAGEYYLIVTADLATSAIANLPRAWQPALREHLLSHARYLHDKRRSEGLPDLEEGWTRDYSARSEAEPGPASFQVPAQSIALLLSTREHSDRLEAALACEDYLFIASLTLTEAALRPLIPLFEAALRRGVNIDVLFGHDGAVDHAAALELLKKLAYDSARQGGGGRMLVNHAPSGCHANVLLTAKYSQDRTTASASFGSHRWLAEAPDPVTAPRSLSLSLSHGAPVAYLCRLMADFAAHDRHLSTGSAPIRLPNLAAALEQELMTPMLEDEDDALDPADAPAPALSANPERPVLRIWIERQQRAAMERLASAARQRLWVFSPQLDPLSTLRELPLLAGTKAPLSVYHGQSRWSDAERGVLEERITKQGGTIKLLPGLRTSLLLADDRHFVLSSHAWFAPFQPVLRTMASTIGIEVEEMDATRQVLPWLLGDEQG